METWQYWGGSAVIILLLGALGGLVRVAVVRLADSIERVRTAALDRDDLNPIISRLAANEGDLRAVREDFHSKVDKVQRDYVRRDDFHREMQTFREEVRREINAIALTIKEFAAERQAASMALNSRFDSLLGMVNAASLATNKRPGAE